MTQKHELGYCERIAEKVRKGAKDGLGVNDIFYSIQTHQKAPRSMRTFYKYYREDMEAARADVIQRVGNKVINQALEGDFRSQHLFLTTKGGWSAKVKEETPDDDDVTESIRASERLADFLKSDDV